MIGSVGGGGGSRSIHAILYTLSRVGWQMED